MAYVTTEQCETKRKACPGHRALPLAVLVIVLLALFGLVLGSHVLLASEWSAARESLGKQIGERQTAAAATETELRIRSVRLTTLETKLDLALSALAEIDARTRRIEGRRDDAGK